MADAEKTLRDLLDEILDDIEYRPREIELKATATGGANFTSALFFVRVSSPDRDELELFAKVACVGEVMRAPMHADWLYGTERLVYTKIAKLYDDIQDEARVSKEHRYVFPKFYGHNAEMGKETIVMEDLVAIGYKTRDRFKSINWDTASAAVENLAKFHALSFALEKYRPELFEKMTLDMKYEIVQGERDETAIAFWGTLVENSVQVLNDEDRGRVRDYTMKTDIWEKYNKAIGKPVISHGDYRMSNLMFRVQDNKLESIAVDYQTVHAGCPAGDLIYFIIMGSDEEFRRQHYDQLLDHYHSSLQQALERLDVDPQVYSREKFDSDMKELLPYAVLLGVMVLPVVTVEAESAPSMNDAEIEDFVMKPNELYAQRFRGIVNDCIRWGVI